MKKFFYLLSLAVLASSCSVGRYMPNAVNNFGIQTQVILDRANFRIVRDVEVVEEINNSHLRRVDVERSAYGKLLRQYPLTGSQAFINVAVEEINRESTSLFRIIFGRYPALKQYVAIRATIIEFLNENGQPIASVSASNQPSVQRVQPAVQFASTPTEERVEQKKEVKKDSLKKEVKKKIVKSEPKTEKVKSKSADVEPVAAPAPVLEEDDSPLISEDNKKYAENLISQGMQYLVKKNADKVLVETYQEIVNRYREKPTEKAFGNIQAVYQYIFDGRYVKQTKVIKKETDKNKRVSVLLNAAYEALED